MDLSKIKDVIKGYSSLLLPIGIVIIGVVPLAVAQLMSSRLKDQIVTKSVGPGEKVQRYLSSAPSINQWEVEKVKQDQLAADVNTVKQLIRQTTERKLLSYDLFPSPAKNFSSMIFQQFGESFRSGIEQELSRVNAGACPSDTEISSIRKSWSSSGRRYKMRSKAVREVGSAIEDELCMDRAQAVSVYCEAEDLDGYLFWEGYSYSKAGSLEKAMKDCWYSQLAYWIIEDVFATISSMNGNSGSVVVSPVKRLISVSFPENLQQAKIRNSRTGSKESEFEKPRYILGANSGITVPCTRRLSTTTGSIDVTHFEMSVVVKASEVLSFMKELCSAKVHEFSGWDGKAKESIKGMHNQITILRCKSSVVERDSSDHQYYRYGEDPVVSLEMTCEYIFDKHCYDQIKPEAVREEVTASLAEIEKAQMQLERRRRRRER
ncbi:MAG: hypothetical protein ACYSWP_00025 [Planctomycetota bacterium]|jgi:hypothetical protein